jgi:hypothetical protein
MQKNSRKYQYLIAKIEKLGNGRLFGILRLMYKQNIAKDSKISSINKPIIFILIIILAAFIYQPQ